MHQSKSILALFLLLVFCACGTETNGSTTKDKGEFAQRSKICHGLDAEKCYESDVCEFVSNVCIPKLPTHLAIETLNVPALSNELVGRQITAMAPGSLNVVYVGTDNGLLIWNSGKVDKVEDFSGGNPALVGLKYVRSIGYSSISQRAYASIGKNADAKDPDSKIIYEITQKTTLNTNPLSPLEITHIFESTPGIMVFGGASKYRFKLLGLTTFDTNITDLGGVTTSTFNPNGSSVWLGTGGSDATKHVGIRLLSADFRANMGDDGKIEPTVWGSTDASPNADISSMAIFGDNILVGLRAKKDDPDTGGIVIFSIYQQSKSQSDKPFLLGTDIRKIIVGEFAHGSRESGLKKRLIILATDNGLFQATLKGDFGIKPKFSTSPVNVDRQGKLVELKEINHIFQQNPYSLWFSSNNTLYFLEVK